MYTRPDVSFPTYRDESGAVIPYGEGWGDGLPAEDSYSRLTHQERFEVAWTLARALVDHLVAEYDVDVVAGPDVDPMEGRAEMSRDLSPRGPISGAPPAVRRLVPRGTGASLTVIETDEPGAVLLAGATMFECAPVCSCDACDESIDEMAGRLESMAFAVVAGRVWERVEGGGLATGMSTKDGETRGWSKYDGDALMRARAAINAATAFAPWPARASAE
jgi:hypothetical protein